MPPAETVTTSLPDPSRTSPVILGALAVAEASDCVRVTPLPLALRSTATFDPLLPPVAEMVPLLDSDDTVPEESRMATAAPSLLLSAVAEVAPLLTMARLVAPASITSARADMPATLDPVALTAPPTWLVSAVAPLPRRRSEKHTS